MTPLVLSWRVGDVWRVRRESARARHEDSFTAGGWWGAIPGSGDVCAHEQGSVPLAERSLVYCWCCSVKPCAPNGIRTRATALKGRRPGPLDDEGLLSCTPNQHVSEPENHMGYGVRSPKTAPPPPPAVRRWRGPRGPAAPRGQGSGGRAGGPCRAFAPSVGSSVDSSLDSSVALSVGSGESVGDGELPGSASGGM